MKRIINLIECLIAFRKMMAIEHLLLSYDSDFFFRQLSEKERKRLIRKEMWRLW